MLREAREYLDTLRGLRLLTDGSLQGTRYIAATRDGNYVGLVSAWPPVCPIVLLTLLQVHKKAFMTYVRNLQTHA